jgi:hypothetical protein
MGVQTSASGASAMPASGFDSRCIRTHGFDVEILDAYISATALSMHMPSGVGAALVTKDQK